MAGNTVRIKLTADDQVSGPLDKIRGKFDTLGTSAGFKTIAKGFGLGVGIGAFNMLTGAIDNAVGAAGAMVQGAIDEEAGIKRLTTAIAANVKGWDGNVSAIERVIEQRMKLGFSDDEQRESLALLVAATGDVDEAMRTQATAMDLARFKGISLKEASEALVKVEAGSYRILKSLGIELRTGATRTEALAAVQRVAAGQAAEWGETTAGAIGTMQIAIDEAGEDIAASFLPALKSVAEFLRDDMIPGLQTVGLGFSYLFDETTRKHVQWADRYKQLDEKTTEELLAIFAKYGADSEIANQAWAMALERTTADGSYNAVEAARGAFRTANLTPAIKEGVTDPVDEETAKLQVIARKAVTDSVQAMSDEFRDGGDDVREAIEAMNEAATKEPMAALERLAILKGQRTAIVFGDAIKSKDPYIRTKAEDALDVVEDEIVALEKWMKLHGTTAGKSFGDGLASAASIAYARKRAAELAGEVSDYFKGLSPPKVGPLKDIDKWGENVGRTYVESFAKGADMRGLLTTPAMPGVAGGRGRGIAGAGVTVVYAPTYSTASVAEAQRFAATITPELVREMRRQGMAV